MLALSVAIDRLRSPRRASYTPFCPLAGARGLVAVAVAGAVLVASGGAAVVIAPGAEQGGERLGDGDVVHDRFPSAAVVAAAVVGVVGVEIEVFRHGAIICSPTPSRQGASPKKFDAPWASLRRWGMPASSHAHCAMLRAHEALPRILFDTPRPDAQCAHRARAK